jgi:hypothetical protein
MISRKPDSVGKLGCSVQTIRWLPVPPLGYSTDRKSAGQVPAVFQSQMSSCNFPEFPAKKTLEKSLDLG